MQISGLMTGFDAASVVDQLMAVERLGANKIKTRQTQAGAVSQALTRLNGVVKSMGDAAKAVSSQITSESIWNSAKATSSNPSAATVTARNGALAGSLTFSVESTATSGALIGGKTFESPTTSIGGDAGQTYSFGISDGEGKQLTEVSIAGGATIEDVAKAINDQKSGVNATVVKVNDNDYRLQLTSNKTGAVSNLTLTDGTAPNGALNLLGSMNTLYNGTDASIKVGEGANAYSLKSSTNTFNGVLPGVDVTVLKADSGTPVTAQVTQDIDGMAAKVQAMVDAANEALSNIRINSKADLVNKGDKKADGVFVGDATTRAVTNQITNVFVGSSANLPSIAGVSIDKSGSITFDKAKFTEAFGKDPAKVEATLTQTAKNLEEVAKGATNATNGSIAMAIKGQDAMVKNYTDQINRFNERMDMKEQTLMRQYNALDSMLSKMKSQGDWLAGQLASLPTPNSNN
ncbi:MAG: flagellar filament capping protein FliD [Dermatophilus congolensis]|nr:flagellar filament capping protein FliD [Dermatophilus congolensis]